MKMKLYDYLREKGFYISKIKANVIENALKQRIPVLLEGRAGTGKTELTRLVAEYLNAKYLFYQCTLGTSEDEFIYKMIPSEDTKSGIKLIDGILTEALKLSKKHRVVVAIDEFDKTRPTADAFLLDFLQNFRVSVRNGDEKIIQGKKENIIVFLTSNAEREFSEPLRRRCLTIKLTVLPIHAVKEILQKNDFSEETIALLLQIYSDTINANLSKIATIQELIQLGKALESSEDIDFTEAVYSFVIKNDEDWQRFTEYANNRKVSYEEYVEKETEKDITDRYEETVDLTEAEDKIKEREPRKPKIRIIKEIEVKGIEKDDDESKEYSAVGEDEDYKIYTTLAKNKPATDDPCRIGEYSVIHDNGKMFIVREKPLKISEIGDVEFKIMEEGGEIYIEDKEYVNFKEAIKEANKIKYYTRNKIAIEIRNRATLLIEKVDDNKSSIKGNLRHITDSRDLSYTLDFVYHPRILMYFIKETYNIEKYREKIIYAMNKYKDFVWKINGNYNFSINIEKKEILLGYTFGGFIKDNYKDYIHVEGEEKIIKDECKDAVIKIVENWKK